MLKLGESAHHVSFGPPGKIRSDRIGVPKKPPTYIFFGVKSKRIRALSRAVPRATKHQPEVVSRTSNDATAASCLTGSEGMRRWPHR